MRRWIAIVLLAFCGHVMILAQEPEVDARKVTERVPAVYPDLARHLNLVGTVRVLVTVAPDGIAKGSEVLGGNPVLAKAAQDAVMRWKWAPAPRETKENVELHFHR